MTRNRPSPRHSGVSLVEALVALAIMAFGMLSLIGVQATMRLNSDLAKQRGEATRIATEEIEQLRSFTSMAVVAGQPGISFDEIASRTVAAYQPAGGIGNTTYRVERTVSLVDGTQQKVVMVRVLWDDRTGTRQTVTIDSVISGTDPVLSGLLSVPARSSATNQRNGRHNSIPGPAVDLGEGRSAFKPFNTGTVVWVFNNLTGLITSRCTSVGAAQASITAADLMGCPPLTIAGRLLAGAVQFDLRAPLPTPLSTASEFPTGPALPLVAASPLSFSTSGLSPVNQSSPADCVSNSPTGSTSSTVAVAYFCLVFPSNNNGWGGKLDVNLASQYPNGDALPNASTPSSYRICRYTTAATDFTSNADHPRSFCREQSGSVTNEAPCKGKLVVKNLINQNFLVTAASQNCPTDVAVNPSTGDLVNSNTLSHPQP